MSIAEKLTQQQIMEILVDIYNKGHKAESIDVKDIVNEIKHQILLSVVSSQND